MEPLKDWIVFLPEKKVELCYFLLTRQIYNQKGLCRSMKCLHGGSVVRGEASFSCGIVCPIYLKRGISANFHFCVS